MLVTIIFLLLRPTHQRIPQIRMEDTLEGISCRLCHPFQLVSLYRDFRLWNCCSPKFQRLVKQLEDLEVPFVEDFPAAIKSTDHIVDAVFGTSSENRVWNRHSILIDHRFQFLGRGPRAVPSRDPGHGGGQSPGNLCRCTVVLEHRGRSTKVRFGQQVSTYCFDQPHCAQTPGHVLQRSPFCRREVRTMAILLLPQRLLSLLQVCVAHHSPKVRV